MHLAVLLCMHAPADNGSRAVSVQNLQHACFLLIAPAPFLTNCHCTQALTTYSLQPKEHDSKLEKRYDWPKGTIKYVNPEVHMHKVPNYYALRVPASKGSAAAAAAIRAYGVLKRMRG